VTIEPKTELKNARNLPKVFSTVPAVDIRYHR